VLRPPNNLTAGHPPDLLTTFVGVYPYHIMPNAQWRNASLPNRRSDGSLVQSVRSAYDIDFLVTCYGDDKQLEPQRMLGALLARLATEPVLTKAMIKSAVVTHAFLAGNNLDTEVETVKFSLLPLSLEEFSKLWSVFFQTAYYTSIAVQASVIFIEKISTISPSLPVYRRNVYVRPIQHPVIEQILSQKTLADPIVANVPIVVGDILVLSGRQLLGDNVSARMSGFEVTPDDISDTQVKVSLTSPPFQMDSLRAGVQGVQTIYRLNISTPESLHQGFESNVAAFVLRPQVTPGPVVVTGSEVRDGITYKDVTLTLNIEPNVGLDQRLVLLLNEYNLPSNGVPHAYRFDIRMPTAPHDPVANVSTSIKNIAAGDYLVRVQVDGAESPLDPGTDSENPKFVGPLVTI
jgi:Pvc16 N-terminal domain